MLKGNGFATKKAVIAERQEAALVTAFNLPTLPALPHTYAFLVAHRKSRELREQGLRPGVVRTISQNWDALFSANCGVTQIWLRQIGDSLPCRQ